MTTTDTVAVRMGVADASALVRTNHPGVAEWTRRYFGPWWRAEPVAADDTTAVDVMVAGSVDRARYDEIVSTVHDGGFDTVLYARKDLYLNRTGTVITAYGEDQVGYVVSGGAIEIAGVDPVAVGSAACRLAREALRGALARAGWVLLHSSAVVRAGKAYLAFGTKGAGKTTVALQLAAATGGALLANDRVFARVDDAGLVTVLPWPAAAAIGLGLLDAAGWYDRVAAARHELHPSTTDAVHDALASGSRTPIHQQERELKPQLYPDQITGLLGVPLATGGTVATLLFPTITAVGEPGLTPGGRDLGADDTFSGKEEDRYPNVFDLRVPEPDQAREAVFRALNATPKLTAQLGHDVTANLTALERLT